MPPLPLAWKLPFHPITGIQTYILISESFDGLRVAVTRQKAGRFLNAASRVPPPAPVNEADSPTATTLTEYFHRMVTPDGGQWLTVISELRDPQHYSEPWVISSHFKKVADNSPWTPEPYSAS